MEYIKSFLLHSFECAFWCYFWHQAHHTFHKIRDKHYHKES